MCSFYIDNLKPKIVEQPKSLAKYSHEEATFMVIAEEPSGTLSYQWQKDGIDIVDDSKHFKGANNNELAVRHLQSQHAGRYCCIVKNEHGQKKSNIARLSLKVKITEQPQNLSRPYHGEAMLQVLATGQEPLTYQWKKDGRDIYNNDNYHGVDSHQLTIKKLTGENEGSYSCVVINDVSEKTESQKATLSVEGRSKTCMPVLVCIGSKCMLTLPYHLRRYCGASLENYTNRYSLCT